MDKDVILLEFRISFCFTAVLFTIFSPGDGACSFFFLPDLITTRNKACVSHSVHWGVPSLGVPSLGVPWREWGSVKRRCHEGGAVKGGFCEGGAMKGVPWRNPLSVNKRNVRILLVISFVVLTSMEMEFDMWHKHSIQPTQQVGSRSWWVYNTSIRHLFCVVKKHQKQSPLQFKNYNRLFYFIPHEGLGFKCPCLASHMTQMLP